MTKIERAFFAKYCPTHSRLLALRKTFKDNHGDSCKSYAFGKKHVIINRHKINKEIKLREEDFYDK